MGDGDAGRTGRERARRQVGVRRRRAREDMSDHEATCPGCGQLGPHGNYSGPEGQRMKQTGECFKCAFWELKAASKHDTVIDGYLYTVGREPGPNAYRSDLGMGGRRFDIEYFDGRR